MATMREVAQQANTSLSTASIVLNGKGRERNISEKTQEAVWAAAAKLNYKPNVAARRLRKGSDDNVVILIFWAEDFRASMLVRFMRGLQHGLAKKGGNVELMFHFYKAGELEQSRDNLDPSVCTAAIVCNTTGDDLVFLEETNFDIPIVLYNRYSDKYCTVNVHDADLGILPAKHLLSHEYRQFVSLNSENIFPGMEIRQEQFRKTLISSGVKEDQILNIKTGNTYRDGYHSTLKALEQLTLPAAIFCASDVIAVGTFKAIHENKLKIPEDISIISVGNGDPELEEYMYPSLSVVELPMEKMASSCIDLTFQLLEMKLKEPTSIHHEVAINKRESTF